MFVELFGPSEMVVNDLLGHSESATELGSEEQVGFNASVGAGAVNTGWGGSSDGAGFTRDFFSEELVVAFDSNGLDGSSANG